AGVAGFVLARLDAVNGRAAELNIPEYCTGIGVGLVAGIVVTFVQGHWHRGLGFVPWAFGLLIVAMPITAIWPTAAWPMYVLGFSAGLPHGPLLIGILAAVPPRQRFAAMLLHPLFAGAAAFLLTAFVVLLPPVVRFWALAALAIVATVVFT